MNYRYGTPVIYGGTLGYVVASRRMYRQDGYDVIEAAPNGDPGCLTLKHWVPAANVVAAVVGGNVCERPWPLCGCGLRHVGAGALAGLVERGGGTA